MSSTGRIMAVTWVETLRLLRARTTFTLLILVPALQVLLFGYAIRPTGSTVTVAIAAPSPAAARQAAATLARLPGLRITTVDATAGAASAAVHAGRALIGVEVPALRSFADPLVVQRPVRVVVDGTNPALTGAAVTRIEAGYWRELADRAGAADGGPGLQVERLYNPDGRPDWTFLPALIGVTVMIAMVMLGSLGLAREREAGTWEALLALPIRPAERLIGKVMPYVVVGTLEGLLVLAAAATLFDLPVRGSVVALVLLLPPFAAAHAILGHAISARAATQLAALQGAVAFYLPAMLLSGFLYPFETLPRWARILGDCFPLSHFIRAARAALLQGASAAQVLAQGGPILAFLLAATLLALAGSPQRLR